MSKRPAVESIPLFCNASVKGEHFNKNKIFSYSMDETWEDVLKDLLEDSNFMLDVVVSWDGSFSSGHDRTNICGSYL